MADEGASETPRVRRHVWVEGRVQGVFFRGRTLEEARAHGVAGWVRNLPDGRVEAVFEGSPAAVDALVAYCRRGPRLAVVRRIEERSEAPEGLREFSVR